MKRLLGLIFIFSIGLGCTAQNPPKLNINRDDNTVMWQVSGNGLKRPSFLYGTFHLMCKEDIHFSNQMKEAIKRSDKIYMEMDMDDPSVMLSGMMYMNMKDGKKLKDLFSPEDYTRLENYFKDSLKIPLMFFQKAKPFFLSALFYPKMMDCANPTGIEQEIIEIVKKDKKEIKGLETMQFQASVFDSIPYEWQAKELLKSIDSFAVNKKEFDKMITIYKDQRLDSMGIMLNSSELGAGQYDDILLNNRNKNWVHQLKDIMKKESVFVAVGAGHLIGEQGLIQLLRKAGYKVQPLENKK
jgi:hypothetical protein